MRSVKYIVILALILAIVFAVAFYALPLPAFLADASSHDRGVFQITLSAVIFSTVINLSVVFLFLLGLKGFTTAFRRTYYLICSGFVVQVIGSLIYLVVLYQGMLGTEQATIIGGLPLMIGALLMCVGLFRFARLLLVQALPVYLWSIGLIAIALLVVIWNLPHISHGGSQELLFDIGHSIFFVETILFGLGAWLTWRIKTVASHRYALSLLWFGSAMLATFVADGLLFGRDYLSYPAWLTTDIISLPFIFTNLFFLFSAYAFHKIIHMEVTSMSSTGNSLVDAITLAASFVSRPKEIDPILDSLRRTTAERQSDRPYTQKEIDDLQNIYLKVEDYLVNHEQLLDLNLQQLRSHIQERLEVTLPSKK